jgi:hypothetical protein
MLRVVRRNLDCITPQIENHPDNWGSKLRNTFAHSKAGKDKEGNILLTNMRLLNDLEVDSGELSSLLERFDALYAKVEPILLKLISEIYTKELCSLSLFFDN